MIACNKLDIKLRSQLHTDLHTHFASSFCSFYSCFPWSWPMQVKTCCKGIKLRVVCNGLVIICLLATHSADHTAEWWSEQISNSCQIKQWFSNICIRNKHQRTRIHKMCCRQVTADWWYSYSHMKAQALASLNGGYCGFPQHPSRIIGTVLSLVSITALTLRVKAVSITLWTEHNNPALTHVSIRDRHLSLITISYMFSSWEA
jgi:hypothetical protein